MLTQEFIKEILNYDADTGIFTRKIRTANCVKIGDIAGTKDTKGYIQIRIKKVKYSAHRMAWLYVYGYLPTLQIDHINCIKDDNRIANLREATQSQNMVNRNLLNKNTSGIVGVNWHKKSKKWRARCTINGKRFNLGDFSSIDDASIAYNNFAKNNQGNFYREC